MLTKIQFENLTPNEQLIWICESFKLIEHSRLKQRKNAYQKFMETENDRIKRKIKPFSFAL